LKKTRLKT